MWGQTNQRGNLGQGGNHETLKKYITGLNHKSKMATYINMKIVVSISLKNDLNMIKFVA